MPEVCRFPSRARVEVLVRVENCANANLNPKADMILACLARDALDHMRLRL